jgi:non-specific serine/threonine protein kinase
LKFLQEKFCRNRKSLEQFRQEARTASALNHPGICTIHDIDQHQNRPFIVMEYLDGETLCDKLRKSSFTIREAVTYGIHIADALGAAHAAGIVHRDVSPSNFFVTRDGRVKLLDFGIAILKKADRSAGTSPAGARSSRLTLTGTVHYMSPEHACGLDVDARSDVFSIGVVLYEMLTGRLPFQGADITAIISQIVGLTPKPLEIAAPYVPDAFQRVVSRCLKKRPEHRYPSAEELREDLELAAAGSPPDTRIRIRLSPVSTLETREFTVAAETISD